MLRVYCDASFARDLDNAGIAACVHICNFLWVQSENLQSQLEVTMDSTYFELQALHLSISLVSSVLKELSETDCLPNQIVFYSDLQGIDGLLRYPHKNRFKTIITEILNGSMSIKHNYPNLEMEVRYVGQEEGHSMFISIVHDAAQLSLGYMWCQRDIERKKLEIARLKRSLNKSVNAYIKGVPSQHELPLLEKIDILKLKLEQKMARTLELETAIREQQYEKNIKLKIEF